MSRICCTFVAQKEKTAIMKRFIKDTLAKLKVLFTNSLKNEKTFKVFAWIVFALCASLVVILFCLGIIFVSASAEEGTYFATKIGMIVKVLLGFAFLFASYCFYKLFFD